MQEDFDIKGIAAKWQAEWEKAGIFKAEMDSKKPKYYVLEMFPYPSASFLHMGHVRNYTIGDVFARFKRMSGFNVLYPMGYDSFGLPAETASKKQGIHPRKYTDDSIKQIMKYQKSLGNSYDWSRMISTCDPDYYKWNQFFFIKMMEHGLAYRKKAPVNWCPNCESVLANEEAEGGKCWRCEKEVVKKDLAQWFMRTTAYSDKLLAGLKDIQWSEKIKTMQENWIGKSYGTEIRFKIDDEEWPIFTTRPDTIFGVTFMVISAQHPRLLELADDAHKKEVEAFIKRCSKITNPEEENLLEKEGVFIGRYATNPVTKEKVPVCAGNFVVADYGVGMVMAVPGHDQRDYEFAKKYDIPIKEVIKGGDLSKEAYVDEGELISSGMFSGMESTEALEKISDFIEKEGYGKRVVNYKIRDWLISRQRYWGTPIPVVYCEHCAKKKQKVIIIHGFEGRKESNWFPWLKSQLEHNGFQVILEDMPNPDHPKLGPWMAKLLQLCKDFDENDIIIGHSLGGKAALHLAEKLKKIGSIYIVAPTPYKGNEKHDWDKLRRELKGSDIDSLKAFAEEKLEILEVEKKSRRRVLMLSTNDPFVPFETHKMFDDNKWEIKSLISRGHILDKEFHELLHEIMKDKRDLGIVPVSEKELPVLLPEDVDFALSKENPLLKSKSFLEAKCPRCGCPAHRETDTMGGFVDSSWYFLRYCSPHLKDAPFDRKEAEYWMPVDQYVGGAEHAVMHLIYARFFTMMLKDFGMISFDEPFTRLFNQGIVYKDGHKMSKSFGNVVFQTDISDKYGIDTARLFLMFIASPDKQMEWSDEAVEGSYRIIKRIIALGDKLKKGATPQDENKINKTIKAVTEAIESFQYPKAVIAVIEALDAFSEGITKEHYEALLKLISPFCPHVAEEMWHRIKNKDFVSIADWPSCDESKIDSKMDAIDALVESTRADINAVRKLTNMEKINKITLIVSPGWKYELYAKLKSEMEKSRNPGDILKALMATDLKRHGQDITRIVPAVVKDPSKLPATILDEKVELGALEAAASKLSEEFGAKIEIVAAEKSKEAKARNAAPGKPAIVLA